MEFLDKHGPPLDPKASPDQNETLDSWLLSITFEELFDTFQDLEKEDYQALAKIFNSRGSREELGSWVMQRVCRIIEQHPEFWERFSED